LRPLRAIETAERFSRGEATAEECRAAAHAAYDAYDSYDAAAAAYYAAHAAYAAADAYYAAHAAAAAVQKQCADLVRITFPRAPKLEEK
jgi:hypothetical protein